MSEKPVRRSVPGRRGIDEEDSNARFQAKAPTIGEYAEHWILGLRLQNSTFEGNRKISRNHVTPYLGVIQLDELTAITIAAHSRRPGQRRFATGGG